MTTRIGTKFFGAIVAGILGLALLVGPSTAEAANFCIQLSTANGNSPRGLLPGVVSWVLAPGARLQLSGSSCQGSCQQSAQTVEVGKSCPVLASDCRVRDQTKNGL
ncbi:MAG: hypothetical protein ACI8TX_000156 [Hyphomicrobiaceae bacterium]|jgi:hypothetical protein